MNKFLKNKLWILYLIFVPFVILDNVVTALIFEKIFEFISTPEIFTVKFVLIVISSIAAIYLVLNVGKTISKRLEITIIQNSIKKIKDQVFLNILNE